MKPIRRIFAFALLLTTLVFNACNTPLAESGQEEISSSLVLVTREQFDHEKMEIGTPQLRIFENTIRVKGIIESPPEGKIQISAFVPGIIRNVKVSSGERVTKGQVLCQLDSKEAISLQQEYIESAAKLKVLSNHYNGAKILYEEKVASELDFLTAESEYKSETARYNALKAKLLMTNLNPEEVERGNITSTINITSPINGYITQHNCTNGQYVETNSFLMEMVDPIKAYLKLFVFQKDIPFIQPSQPVRFYAPSRKELVYDGILKVISKSVDPVTLAVICSVDIDDNNHEGLIIGQNVEADIIYSIAETLGVPGEAIFRIDEKDFLLVKVNEDQEGYHFQKTEIKTGLSFNGWTEVIGIEGQKNILLRGGYNLNID